MVAARDAPGGFLRLVAWVTLLMQSADVLPPVVVLDRPDSDIPRGAVGLVHRLMSKVSDQGTQVIASLAGSASPVA
jgi:predicted ATPase